MLPALAWLVAGGWSTQQQYLLEPVLAGLLARWAGRGKEGCKLVPQAVVASAVVAGRGAGVRGEDTSRSALLCAGTCDGDVSNSTLRTTSTFRHHWTSVVL